MKRGLLLLLPVLAIAVAAWAFTSNDGLDLDLDLDPVASAATRTSDAGSARVAFETALRLNGRKVELGGQGLFDFEESRGAMTLDASPLLPAAAGKGSFELRMIGSTMYIRIPAALSGQGIVGGRWIAFDVKDAANAAGFSLPQSSLQQDPVQTLRLLRASSTGVTKAGTARVRGTQTTRYKAKLDLRKAIEASADELGLSKQEQEQLQRAAEHLSAQAGLKLLPVEVFVDAQGLLRRMRVNLKASPGAASFSLVQTTDYYDFGVDVDVKAPPKSQVLDLPG